MSPQRNLTVASIVFAVVWTTGMIFWNNPQHTAGLVILAIAGALAGTLWYLGTRWWMRTFSTTGW